MQCLTSVDYMKTKVFDVKVIESPCIFMGLSAAVEPLEVSLMLKSTVPDEPVTVDLIAENLVTPEDLTICPLNF